MSKIVDIIYFGYLKYIIDVIIFYLIKFLIDSKYSFRFS